MNTVGAILAGPPDVRLCRAASDVDKRIRSLRKIMDTFGFSRARRTCDGMDDQLACLVRRGASVRLYCEKIETFREDNRREPPYLVHTKMLLFKTGDGEAELWIGSHNWTRRALVGLNAECSLVVRLLESAKLFLQAAQYLDEIRRVSSPFDPSKTKFYKRLQGIQPEGEEETVGTIEIEAPDAGLLKGTAITVFGTEPQELRQVGALRDVYVHAFEEAGTGNHLYCAKVMHSGLMPNYSVPLRDQISKTGCEVGAWY